jgi:hypothetical protein
LATYAWNAFKVEVDSAVGGSLTDMSAYITEVGDIEVEALTQEVTPATTAAVAHLYTGILEGKPLTIKGVYDDTASTGPNVVFVGVGGVRSVKITYGASKTTAFEAIIKSYKRGAKKGEMTAYEVTLLPTGTITEA